MVSTGSAKEVYEPCLIGCICKGGDSLFNVTALTAGDSPIDTRITTIKGYSGNKHSHKSFSLANGFILQPLDKKYRNTFV